MASYRLPKTAKAELILSGRQLGIIAMPRSVGTTNPHVVAGQPLALRIATSNKPSQDTVLPARPCVLYAEVVFSKTGVVRVTFARPLNPGTVEGVHALLVNAEPSSPEDSEAANLKAANALGFETYAALWVAHGHKSLNEAVRVVLAWAPPVALTDADEAPEWPDEAFDRAEIRQGETVIRPASGTLTKAGVA